MQKKSKRKQIWVTSYDALTARMAQEAGVDGILVGDSVATVLLGYDSTLPVTMDEMIHHAKAVRRGAPKAWIVGDLPFLGIKGGPRQALDSSRRFIHEAKMNAVKLEWGPKALEIAKALRQNQISFMGHTGLTPQRAKQLGGYKVQGLTMESAKAVYQQTMAMAESGANAIVLECVPMELAAWIRDSVSVPVIGIGAGSGCDGQILVFHDLVGMNEGFAAKFLKRFGSSAKVMKRALEKYIQDVKVGRFPDRAHSYAMDPEIYRALRQSSKKWVSGT